MSNYDTTRIRTREFCEFMSFLRELTFFIEENFKSNEGKMNQKYRNFLFTLFSSQFS